MREGEAAQAEPRDLAAPLMYRDAELSLLRRAAERSRSLGQTRVVTLLGAAGIGKSRLIDEFARELAEQPGDTLRVFRGTARSFEPSYGMFARLLRSRFGLLDSAEAELNRAKLHAEVAALLEDRKVGDVCFFLGKLLDLSFPESPLTRALIEDSAQARALQRAVMRNLLERDSSSGPLCLVFEELQHAGEDSLDLLCYLIEHLSGPILIVCSTRPELAARSERYFESGRERHERVELAPLSPEQASELMRQLLCDCDAEAAEPLVRAAVNTAGGNPGLLEQMLHVFRDSGVLRHAESEQRSEVDLSRLAKLDLPLTVDDAVSARIAALSAPSRRLLEHAAAMGSVFWLGGLVTLARREHEAPELWRAGDTRDIDEITALIEELVARDYVLELPDSAFAGEREFVFKHNLERERIAVLTTTAQSRQYHQTIADWLSQRESVYSHAEYSAILASHLERAGNELRSGLTYLAAGDLARQVFAAKQAHELYQKGLALLGDRDAARRIDALHNYGDALLAIGKTDEALGAFREMRSLAHRLGLMGKGGAAHNRIGRLHRETGALGVARQHFDTALDLFRAVKDERGIAACHDDLGKLLWTRGEYDEALEQLKIALEIRKQIGDRRSIALSLNNIGLVWMERGQLGSALEALQASLQIRREIGDPLGIAESLSNLGRLAQQQNQAAQALESFREALDVAKEVGENYRIAAVLTQLGDCYFKLGRPEDAVRILSEAGELCDELGDRLNWARARRKLAKVYLDQGELRKAREAIKQAVDVLGRVRSKSQLAIALRALGEITGAGAWGKGHEGKAVDYFLKSIAICKEIGNELEVAKSYKAFSNYVSESPHYKTNADIQREAGTLREMADEIFERHRIPAGVSNGSSDVALEGT